MDIRGVVWLDRASAELRRVEYSYANLPKTTYEMCDDAPMNVPVAERKRRCQSATDDAANRLGLGGELDFQRLATGEWLVASWAMRKPPDEGKVRKYFSLRACETGVRDVLLRPEMPRHVGYVAASGHDVGHHRARHPR